MDCTDFYVPTYSKSFKLGMVFNSRLPRMWRKQDEDESSSIDGLPYGILDWAVYSELYRSLLSLVNVDRLDNSTIYSQLQELLVETLRLNEEKI